MTHTLRNEEKQIGPRIDDDDDGEDCEGEVEVVERRAVNRV